MRDQAIRKSAAHVARVRRAQARERAKARERSPRWPAVRRRLLAKSGECAACGSRRGLQVHHVRPFHLAPELELDPANLIALCEYVGGPECHEFVGHGGNFGCYNPNVRADAADLRGGVNRAAVRARARAARLE